MTAFVAGDRYKAPYAGEVGNGSSWSGYYKFAATGVAANDTVDLFKVPAGAKIDEILEVHTALASGTLSIGWRYEDGVATGAGTPSATAFKNGASIASAGNTQTTIMPNSVFSTLPTAAGVPTNTAGAADRAIIVYATVGGATPANVELYVAAKGEFVGTK